MLLMVDLRSGVLRQLVGSFEAMLRWFMGHRVVERLL